MSQECQHHAICGDYAETEEEIAAGLCCHCLQAEKEREQESQELKRLQDENRRLQESLRQRLSGICAGFKSCAGPRNNVKGDVLDGQSIVLSEHKAVIQQHATEADGFAKAISAQREAQLAFCVQDCEVKGQAATAPGVGLFFEGGNYFVELNGRVHSVDELHAHGCLSRSDALFVAVVLKYLAKAVGGVA